MLIVFKLETVISEHNRRLLKNDLHESYDEIERDDVELSRTVVESLLSETFQEKIEIRFSHRDDFENTSWFVPFYDGARNV